MTHWEKDFKLIDLKEIKKALYLRDITIKQIAKKLNLTPNSIRSRLTGNHDTGYQNLNQIFIAAKEILEEREANKVED